MSGRNQGGWDGQDLYYKRCLTCYFTIQVLMEAEDVVYLINQLFTIQQKVISRDLNFLDRNFSRVMGKLENLGYLVINPIGETYTDTRTDLSAHIASDTLDELKVKEVIKPIIYFKHNDQLKVIQVGNVIVG